MSVFGERKSESKPPTIQRDSSRWKMEDKTK